MGEFLSVVYEELSLRLSKYIAAFLKLVWVIPGMAHGLKTLGWETGPSSPFFKTRDLQYCSYVLVTR